MKGFSNKLYLGTFTPPYTFTVIDSTYSALGVSDSTLWKPVSVLNPIKRPWLSSHTIPANTYYGVMADYGCDATAGTHAAIYYVALINAPLNAWLARSNVSTANNGTLRLSAVLTNAPRWVTTMAIDMRTMAINPNMFMFVTYR